MKNETDIEIGRDDSQIIQRIQGKRTFKILCVYVRERDREAERDRDRERHTERVRAFKVLGSLELLAFMCGTS